MLSIAELGAPHLIAALDLPPRRRSGFRVTLFGASLQVLTLLGMLLLYYLDLRREAFVIAMCQLVSIAGGTSAAIFVGAPARSALRSVLAPRDARGADRAPRRQLARPRYVPVAAVRLAVLSYWITTNV